MAATRPVRQAPAASEILDKLNALEPQRRAANIELAVGLPRDIALSWFDDNIPSPVSGGWAFVAYTRRADWNRLRGWLAKSKLRCLIAASTLSSYAQNDERPDGLTDDWNVAIDEAERSFGNLRLRETFDYLRHEWS